MHGVRSMGWILAALAVTSTGLGACSSTDVTDSTLSFTVAESLLVLVPDDPIRGAVVLSSTTGNCARFQTGVDFSQIANSSFLFFLLGELDANDTPVPLDGGTYTIVDPDTDSFSGPGGLANAVLETTNVICVPNASTATDGTVTLSPFVAADGGISGLSYAAVFDNKRISGTNTLTTCQISASVGPDAGTCLVP